MQSTSKQFPENAHEALQDEGLQQALQKLSTGFPLKRLQAAKRLPEFEALRDQARNIKNHVLENLDYYLEQFEDKVTKSGGHVHWCRNSDEARQTILDICQKANAKTVTKSKSMIGEEIAINDFLETNGVTPIETDLGEYIIQLRHEPPSHIIAPAIHLSKQQVAETFLKQHVNLDPDRDLDQPRQLLEEAREQLRQKFLQADVGLTGANMLVAETGSNVLVTNEGNADLTYGVPKVHIVVASLEKIVPTLEDATTVLRVLARSATGQEMSVYTTFCTGPKRPEDTDGPEQYHVVLLDNGRTDLIATEFQEMLRCIRCGACLNHCPVYKAVGGHAYGWVYSGPMGAVLIPGLIGMDEASHLPNASTLCGRCESICPMRIPLPKMLRDWRTRNYQQGKTGIKSRYAMAAWAFMAKRPKLYHGVMGIISSVLSKLGKKYGRFKSLPAAGAWCESRDLPAPQGGTFIQQWQTRRKQDREQSL